MKTKRKSKMMAVLIACILVVGLFPVTAFAADIVTVTINGERLTDGVPVQCGEGTVVLNEQGKTLTLENATISEKDTDPKPVLLRIDSGELTVKLIGENTITTVDARPLYFANSNITIKGGQSDTLTVETGTSAIQVDHGNITIDGCTVKVVSESYEAIVANFGKLSVVNHATVIAHANTLGLSGSNGISIVDSTVEVTSAAPECNAIYSEEGNIDIQRSEVTAKSESDRSYSAMFGTTGVSISESVITAESGGDAAIYSPEDVSITNNSQVTATGYWPAIHGEKQVVVSDSEVNAVSNNDVAIYSPLHVGIANSIVNATGAEGADGILSRDVLSVRGSWITTSGAETYEGNIEDSVLINGNAGSVIGNATVPGDVTIPAGTTLTIPAGKSLTIPAGVNLTNNGTLKADCDAIIGTVNGKETAYDHSWDTGWSSNDTHHWHACTVVGCPETDPSKMDGYAQHSGGTATCKDKAKCDLCGQEYGALDANHMDLVKTEAKAATHLAQGNIAYWHCGGCQKYFSDAAGTDEITLAETVVEKTAEHTVDKTGWHSDENKHWNTCECGEKLGEEAHNFEWMIDKEATATEKGSKHEECTVCGYKKATVEIPASGGGTGTSKPTTSTKPSKPSSGIQFTTSGESNKINPNTGVIGSHHPWLALFLASGIGLCAATASLKNRKKSR